MSTMNLKISIAPARANMKVTFGSGANAAAYLETLVATIARGPEGPQGPQGESIQGPRGIQGPQGETAVANINFRGPYVPGTPYYHADVNGDTDVVRSPLDGNTYYCLVDNTGNEPSTSPTYWTLFVMQGGRGEQGEQGDKGDKGDRGPAGESIPKKAVMMFAGGADEVPEGFWLCNGDDVPGYGRVPDLRSRFVVGLDPRATDYNAIGKIGGLKDVTLTMGQMPIHDHHNAAFNQLLWKDPSGNSTSYKTDRTVGEVDILHSATILSAGNNEAHENRPPYYTLAFIIRVSDPVVVLSGIESVVAGTNVEIDVTDPKNPIINVPEVGSSTETAPYVLSGLDADIKTGVIASHTILEKHQFTAADIYAEVTTMPEVLGIVVDVLKNGVSIFSTKPSIAAGALHSVGTHVLVTSPTLFNAGDIRSISVDQMGVGDGKTGKNLKLSILMHKII